MRNWDGYLSDSDLDELITAVHDSEHVSGLTHDFYRYPARFSPVFVRDIIKLFTEHGDLVVDPFMGGATTLVEARVLGRRCIGVDVNGLSAFLAQTKTLIFCKKDLHAVYDWAVNLGKRLNLHNPPVRAEWWISKGYQRNINGKNTWPTRKILEFILAYLDELDTVSQKKFARCALLKTSQWALDCTTKIPSAKEFRERFLQNIIEMSEGALEFSKVAQKSDHLYDSKNSSRTICLNRSAIGIEEEPVVQEAGPPKLILTSPPYLGVHVIYHRWQIRGRRETPAPFWIANAEDGCGESFYTFGYRMNHSRYYENLLDSYKSLAQIADKNTLLVQMVGFSKPSVQLSKYLEIIDAVGFSECKISALANMKDGRLWRSVPNRKWYATKKGSIGSSKEVVLFHKIK